MRRAGLVTIAAVWAIGCGSSPDGRKLFQTTFTAGQGLGPQFNDRSCAGCHTFPRLGGVGPDGLATVTRLDAARVTRSHAIDGCERGTGIPAGSTVVSIRNAQPLFGAGRIDTIPEPAIISGARRQTTVSGRPNLVGGRVGRFGWKADAPTLRGFVAEAFRNELGLTSPEAPHDRQPPRCGPRRSDPDLPRDTVTKVATFIAHLPVPAPARPSAEGAALFARAGCAACHTPDLAGVPLYSDLLLHDMGPLLDDGVSQGLATGAEWRTAPLWGLRHRPRLLHDGRATSPTAAILAHGGEAGSARRRFAALSLRDRRRLLAFLESL